MRHAFTMFYQGLFGRAWRSELEQTVFWIGLYRGTIIGLIVGTIIARLA